MKKVLSVVLALALLAAIAVGCANVTAQPDTPLSTVPQQEAPAPTPSPAPVPATTADGQDAAEDDEPEQVGAQRPVIISVEELIPIFEDENVILIGAISPAAALVPFSNAANPIRGSFLVWTDDIYGPDPTLLSSDLGFGRIPASQWEDLLSRTGGTPDSTFVVYHSDAAAVGARVAWHLYQLGLDVRFLDGGVAAWRAANGRTGSSTRLTSQPVRGEFRAPNYDPSINNVTLQEVMDAAQDQAQWVIVDTRTLAEYNGEHTSSSSGGFGTGRIKDSVHIEWTRLHDEDGFVLPEDELLEIFSFIGDRNVIVFCQGGIRSSYSWIVLRDLGYNVRNFDGSWIEWSYALSSASDFPKDVISGLTELWSDNGAVIR